MDREKFENGEVVGVEGARDLAPYEWIPFRLVKQEALP
jgi:hypothetical protein